MKKINIKLTVDELYAIAVATAEHWIKIKDQQLTKSPEGKVLKDVPKNWKKLSEYLFAIYRINRK